MRIIPVTALVILLAAGCCRNRQEPVSVVDYVDPHIGGVGHLLQPTRPTVQLPNQVIRMYPVRADYLDDQISCFPLTISSHRRGLLFGILPGTGDPLTGGWKERQTYDHDLEVVHPHYYKTYLIDEDITVEFVPGEKAGYFRFIYPSGSGRILKMSILNSGSWSVESNNGISGVEEFSGMKAYVYGRFSSPFTAEFREQTIENRRQNTTRNEPQLWISFSGENQPEVEFKYAISFISPEQAQRNLDREIAAWDFGTLKENGLERWEKALGQISVKGGTTAQRRTFYTALYRTYERMVSITEEGRYYSAYDRQIHESSRDFYVDDWVWDSYLAHHPLRMILAPGMQADMLHSFVEMYRQGGWMPQFPLLAGDDPAMHGFHSTVVFLDAYRKHIRDYDVSKAYEGCLKNATDATMLPWRNGPRTVLDHFYREKGFYPALWPGEEETVPEVHDFEKRQSVAITLAHSYDDWALAQLAGELGHDADSGYYMLQAENYRNLYRPEKSLMWPKDRNGEWIDIDPKFDGGPGGRDYYDENNGYTYQWMVQHDIGGLMDLMGGREKFTANLDQLFREDLGRTKYQYWAKFPDATGMVGQFSMGNEPSFHIPYLYNYAGEPWKTQKRIRFLLDVWFKDNIFGIPGDEDGGAMSAFVVFSAMGFYPVTPGLPVYTIGSPLFEEVNINLENGRVFTIRARNSSRENKYVQSARLNGKPLSGPWFTHDELMAGAVIELEMGPKPNREWGKDGSPF